MHTCAANECSHYWWTVLIGVARRLQIVVLAGAGFEAGGVFDCRAEAVRCLGLYTLLEARGTAGADALACLHAAAAEEVPAVAAVAVAALADAALLWCAACYVQTDRSCSLVSLYSCPVRFISLVARQPYRSGKPVIA